MRPPSRNLNRRAWLQLGAFGALGLSLPRLLRADEARRSAPAARSCVLFLLHGGPSQLDTWDMKPGAPAEVRGEFRPIATNVPGTQIVEHLPRLAAMADRYTIVRSMTHASLFHNTATSLVMTGNSPLSDLLAFTPSENDFPHLGAQLALKDTAGRDVPAAVSLPDPVTDGPYTTPGQNGGFLGARYAPFRVYGDPNDERFVVDGLAAGPELLHDRLQGRRSLLSNINGQQVGLPADSRVAELDGYQQRAFSLLASSATRQAFEMSQEDPRVRDGYGRHKYGQSLLLARRLVEAGVQLVTVYWGGKVNNPVPYWDTHVKNNRRLKEELLPPFDQCFSAFLEDLKVRGLLESTLVVCMGEFGRTPRFGQNTGNGVDDTGRDHWPHCYSLLVAGGRAGGGRVLGRSDRFAAYPADDPYTPADLTASILHALGVDPFSEVRDAFGRLVPLSTGRVRSALFGA
ncbi:MAG: DUF1501 domain-containing protein [Planctomycetia bacterium]|nr:DUF1501 domain-containing protein [Planctomycetia bacterium]